MRAGGLAWLVAAWLALAACSTAQDGGGEVEAGEASQGGGETLDEICVPKCSGQQCGPDGCGGVCGACHNPCTNQDDDSLCHNGACAAVCCPSCFGKKCGDDGCGGSCGQCEGGKECQAGTCVVKACSESNCQLTGQHCDPASGDCVNCANDGHCGQDQRCVAHACVPWLCEPGEARCQDGVPYRCKADAGGWEAQAECGATQVCLQGACVERVCQPGERECQADVLRTCAPDGGSWLEEECAPQGVCKGDVCVIKVCTPQEVRCLGQVLSTCGADGTGWSGEPCPDGQYCEGAACLEQVCVPGWSECTGLFTRQVCNAIGSALVDEGCPPQEYCSSGQCHAQACQPLAAGCVDLGARHVCEASGAGWGAPEACAAQAFCQAGACVPAVCQEGAVECDGPAGFHLCGPRGSAWLPQQDCPEHHFCEAGQCLPQVCEPDGTLCLGEELWVCSHWGSGTSLSKDCAAQGAVCLHGECVVPQLHTFRAVSVVVLAPDLTLDLGQGPMVVNALVEAFINAGLGTQGEAVAQALTAYLHVEQASFGPGECTYLDGNATACGFAPGATPIQANSVTNQEDAPCYLDPPIPAPCFVAQAAAPGQLTLLTAALAYQQGTITGHFVPDYLGKVEVVVEVFVTRDSLAGEIVVVGDASFLWSDLLSGAPVEVLDGVEGWWFKLFVTGKPVGTLPQGRSKVAFQSPSPRRKPGSRPERTLDSGFRRNDDCDRGRHQGDFASALHPPVIVLACPCSLA